MLLNMLSKEEKSSTKDFRNVNGISLNYALHIQISFS